jgi:hypothetical protein
MQWFRDNKNEKEGKEIKQQDFHCKTITEVSFNNDSILRNLI